MNLTPSQQAKRHHDLAPLEVWSVYTDPAKQAEYNRARYHYATQELPDEAKTTDSAKGWALAFLGSLLAWAVVAAVVVGAITLFNGVGL